MHMSLREYARKSNAYFCYLLFHGRQKFPYYLKCAGKAPLGRRRSPNRARTNGG